MKALAKILKYSAALTAVLALSAMFTGIVLENAKISGYLMELFGVLSLINLNLYIFLSSKNVDVDNIQPLRYNCIGFGKAPLPSNAYKSY